MNKDMIFPEFNRSKHVYEREIEFFLGLPVCPKCGSVMGIGHGSDGEYRVEAADCRSCHVSFILDEWKDD